jgi:hypothetical protein
VYANARQDEEVNAFDAKLDFDINLIAYKGDDSWVEPTLLEMKKVLSSDTIPPVGTSFGGVPCEHCLYREAAGKALQGAVGISKPVKIKKQPLKKNNYAGKGLFD